MRIDELRSTLHEHGADVVGETTATRVAAVHGRIRTARRRRVAAAAGGTVAAVAAVALAVVPGLGSPAPAPGPADAPTLASGYTKDGVTFRGEVFGERLLGAAIGDPGQSAVSFDFVVGETGLRFSPLCFGAGPDRTVVYAVEGDPVGSVRCGRKPEPDPGAVGSTFEAPAEKVLLDWGLAPGDTATMSVRLVASRDSDGPTVEDPQAVIGAGVYEDTRSTLVVAGVEVPKRVEHDGRTWELVGTYESDPGEDRLWIGAEGTEYAGDYLVVATTSGFRGESVYEIRLDGTVVDGASQATGASGPSWQTVRVLRAGRPHELELTVQKGATPRTRLAFLTYEPAE